MLPVIGGRACTLNGFIIVLVPSLRHGHANCPLSHFFNTQGEMLPASAAAAARCQSADPNAMSANCFFGESTEHLPPREATKVFKSPPAAHG